MTGAIRLRRFPVILFAIATLNIGVFMAGPGPGESKKGFEVGTRFPDLSLPSVEDGRPLSLASFRGQKVLLHVFASW